VKTWEEIGRAHDVAAGERIRVKRMLCDRMKALDFVEGRHTFGGSRRSYVIFTPEWIAAIESLAEGGADESRPNTGEPPSENDEKQRAEARIPRLEAQVPVAQGVK
jgi:hypothetical protein